jgi:hypothetical protein
LQHRAAATHPRPASPRAQLLPLVPPETTYWSPYSGLDALCGNTLMLPVEELVQMGLLEAGELPPEQAVELHADFSAVAEWKVGRRPRHGPCRRCGRRGAAGRESAGYAACVPAAASMRLGVEEWLGRRLLRSIQQPAHWLTPNIRIPSSQLNPRTSPCVPPPTHCSCRCWTRLRCACCTTRSLRGCGAR